MLLVGTSIEPISNIDDKYIEKTYKELLNSGTYEDLIIIIKTTYLRNDNRIKNNKKISDNVDYRYFGGTVYKTHGYNAGSKYTGSHGCVNIPVPKMQTIYDNVSVGTPVYVH